ncbi:Spaetzle [Trinorchestia longiramus]|nr:Spaetzle [Trinorchestia longiramus]
MALLRSNLGWFVAVYWLFVGAAEIRADYDQLSCSRESRSFQPKPDVPCDLVKNTFCDTSGDNYPWTKLRKFVFENQGLIKRMYGYQTHYTILKDELLEAFDEDAFYDPLEMYSPEAQVILPEHTQKVRNSVRSNAFKEKYKERSAATDDRASHREWQAEGQIYFDVRAEKIPKQRISSNRRQNTRHIDDGSSRSRDVKMMSFQHSGKRSIDSSLDAVPNDQQLDDDKSNKAKTTNNFGALRTVQIKQGYSQSTVEGTPTLTPQKLKSYSTEHGSGEPDAVTDSAAARQSVEFSTSKIPADDHASASLKVPGAQDPSKFHIPLLNSAKSEENATAKEDKRKIDILFEELLNRADIITAESPTASQQPESHFIGDADSGVTERSVNATAPRPPGTGADKDFSSASLLSESLITQQNEDYVTTEAGVFDTSWRSTETQEVGVSLEDDMNETITLNPEDRSSSKDEVDMVTEMDILNADRISVELGTEDVSSQMDSSNFKFPDEMPTNRESQGAVDPQSRRNTNTRRPASAESRQPNKQQSGNKWSGYEHSIEASPTVSIPTRRHSQFHSGGKKTSNKQPSEAQEAMWRRPQLEEDEQITSPPMPPTPSTIPTPLPSAPLKKGVNACPVETDVVAPYWANNTRGEVLALLNLSPFEQYVHWEKCRYEYRQMYCRQGCRCEQQYRLHRMLAFDPTNDCRGIFSDWFRFPSGCVCKCYDLPEQATRIPALYSRRPRGRSQLEPDQGIEDLKDHGHHPVQQDLNHRSEKEGDLSDVYFESEDALFPIDQAQDRMDDGYLGDEEILFDGATTTAYKSSQRRNHIDRKHLESETAVLHGDPVSSLYSRAEASKPKPKVQMQSIPPQRRPRPHVIGQRRQAALQQPNQDHGYNLRFSPSARSLRYSPLASLSRYNYQPTQQFLSRRQYYQNRRFRARNGWNPQASFPSNLSNSRFLKYIDSVDSRKISAASRVDDVGTDQGSNNLNLNHLLQPAPTSRILPSLIASSQLPNPDTFDSGNVQTPQYFFNLTSHLIRTEQLDSRRPHASAFNTREPRNFFSDVEP